MFEILNHIFQMKAALIKFKFKRYSVIKMKTKFFRKLGDQIIIVGNHLKNLINIY